MCIYEIKVMTKVSVDNQVGYLSVCEVKCVDALDLF